MSEGEVGPQEPGQQPTPINAELRYRLAQCDFALHTLRTRHEEAERRIEALEAVEARLAELEQVEQRVVEEANLRISTLEDELNAERAESERRAAELEEVRGRGAALEEAERRVTQLTSELESYEQRLVGAEGERDRWRSVAEGTEQRVTELRALLHRLSSELTTALHQLDPPGEVERNLEVESEQEEDGSSRHRAWGR